MSTVSTNTTQLRASAQQWKPHSPTKKSDAQPVKRDYSADNCNPETGVSLCVPFAFKNVGPKRVFAIFRRPHIEIESPDDPREELMGEVSLGFIERIDIKYRQDGNKCLFIHFAPGRWNDTKETRFILNAMKAGKPLHVITNDKGNYWKTIISNSKRPADYQEDDAKSSASNDTDDVAGEAVEMADEFA